MYRNFRSPDRVNGYLNDDFLVQVASHRFLVLSFQFFFILLEASWRKIKSGYPMQLLYATDVALLIDSLEYLKGKPVAWEAVLKSKS